MTLMQWDGSLELGDAMLDRQHRSLVDLINRVQAAAQSPNAEAEVMRAITAMYLYAKEHFFDEEGLMARLGYPDLAGHKARHKGFVAKANELTDACMDGRVELDELLQFLVGWLGQHIAVEDARIVRHATRHGEQKA